jgi:hypothetical protein
MTLLSLRLLGWSPLLTLTTGEDDVAAYISYCC